MEKSNLDSEKKITEYPITCSDAERCIILSQLHNQYNPLRIVKNYCSKHGQGCSVKVSMRMRRID